MASLRAWWRSWYEREEFDFPLPEGWELVEARIPAARALSDQEIREKLAQPLGSPRLGEIAKGRDNACIAIDDLTRPTETFRILPILLDELNGADIPDERILVLVSLGTHHPLDRNSLLKKVGRGVLDRVRVYNHNPYLNLKEVGTTEYGTPVLINRMFADADLKLSIGLVAPHSYAGFSAGGKIVLPGLASWETVLANHAPASKVLSGQVGQIEGNSRRTEIDQAAGLAGLEFSINVVCNEKGETADLYAGEVSQAWKAAASAARRAYRTQVPVGADIGIFNAFPKDTELLQALNSLTPWNPSAGKQDVVRPGGTIVVITAASEGHGWLGLINPGGPLHQRRDRNAVYKAMLKDRALYFLSPNLGRPDLQDHYPPEVEVVPDWNALLSLLRARHPEKARVAFFPCGPLQIGSEELASTGAD